MDVDIAAYRAAVLEAAHVAVASAEQSCEHSRALRRRGAERRLLTQFRRRQPAQPEEVPLKRARRGSEG
jgi:uncharacterized protein with PIN domain